MIGRLRARFWPYLARCPRCRGYQSVVVAPREERATYLLLPKGVPPCTLCGDVGQVTEAMASAYILTRGDGLTVTNAAASMRDALDAAHVVAPWRRRRGIRKRMSKGTLGMDILARKLAKLGLLAKK